MNNDQPDPKLVFTQEMANRLAMEERLNIQAKKLGSSIIRAVLYTPDNHLTAELMALKGQILQLANNEG